MLVRQEDDSLTRRFSVGDLAMMRCASLSVLALLSGGGLAYADQGLAIGGSIGTTGGGLEATAQITPGLQVRGGYNIFSYGLSETFDDIAYQGDLDLTSWGAFVDLRPFLNSFVVSAGAFIGDKGLRVAAAPSSSVRIGNQTYSPAQVGTLSLTADLAETAPFLGIGWDTTFQGDGVFGFRLMAGAMMSGTPEISLAASGGLLSTDPAFLAEVSREEQNLRSDVEAYEIYPVVQAGLTFRF